MTYANKIHAIIFIIVCTFYVLTPEKGMKVSIEQVQAKEVTTKTGGVEKRVVQTVQTWGKEDWKKKQLHTELAWWIPEKICEAQCKAKHLVSLGISERVAYSLVYSCKNSAIDAVNCIKLGASIVTAESGGGKKCHKNNCFWMGAWSIWYDSVEDSVEHWVSKYNRFWLNQKNPSSFYSNSPDWKPKTRYCLSEYQPDGTHLPYCKNWYKHAWNIFNKLEKLF